MSANRNDPRGKVSQVSWQPSDDEPFLKSAYQQERDAMIKPRLHLLWLVRQGKQVQAAAALVGVNRRTAHEWLLWYRQGGLEQVRAHKRGGHGKPSRLDGEQKAALIAKAQQDGFVSIRDGVRFVREQFGIEYTESGMTKVFSALQLRKKVPRPRNAKATEEAQEGYKKGG
jgi:transposase